MVKPLRFILTVVLSLCAVNGAWADSVETERLNHIDGGQRLLFKTNYISNSNERTTVGFNVECQDLPFSVDSLETPYATNILKKPNLKRPGPRWFRISGA